MSKKPQLFGMLTVTFLPETVIRVLNKYQKLITYAVIGGGAVVIDVGLFWALNELANASSLLSNTVSVFIAMLYSFVLNAFFNFRTRDKLVRRFVGFAAVTTCGYFVSSATLWLFSDKLGVNATLVKTLGLPLILMFQFSLNSRFTFQATMNKEDQVLESIN
jgi:putative flippase GtrA